MVFFGIHKYDTKLVKAVAPANITDTKSTFKDSLRLGLPLKNVQKYSIRIIKDIKKDASQIRRCQKRVNVIGLILPPITITNLEDIMTIMVCFYKSMYVLIEVERLSLFLSR
jgi:hypothetical protein